MPFTAQELENIANSVLDFYFKKGQVVQQSIQDKPLLAAMRAAQKTFPGGKENISVAVQGEYTGSFMGFTHDDTVSYSNPANVKRANFPWKEVHDGISVTLTELKKDGISITDTTTGRGESAHSQREMTALVNLLENKLFTMMESFDRGMNSMYWRDGAQDSKQVPGILSFILDDPTSATVVGGIDQSSNTWWRNRASLSINSSTASDQNLVNKLQTELRQLRRYAKRTPKFKFFAGSSFIEALEKEIRSKGNYTDNGFRGQQDAGMGDLSFKGIPVVYDPTLDDLSRPKYGFLLDMAAIYPMVMEGEDMKRHNPARPEDKYVLYRAITWTGGLVCDQRNTSGVYSIS